MIHKQLSSHSAFQHFKLMNFRNSTPSPLDVKSTEQPLYRTASVNQKCRCETTLHSNNMMARTASHLALVRMVAHSTTVLVSLSTLQREFPVSTCYTLTIHCIHVVHKFKSLFASLRDNDRRWSPRCPYASV